MKLEFIGSYRIRLVRAARVLQESCFTHSRRLLLGIVPLRLSLSLVFPLRRMKLGIRASSLLPLTLTEPCAEQGHVDCKTFNQAPGA